MYHILPVQVDNREQLKSYLETFKWNIMTQLWTVNIANIKLCFMICKRRENTFENIHSVKIISWDKNAWISYR